MLEVGVTVGCRTLEITTKFDMHGFELTSLCVNLLFCQLLLILYYCSMDPHF